jgi:hypothetical protein
LSAFGPFGGVGDARRFAQKHFAEDRWIMTLTTEKHSGARRMSETGGKDVEDLEQLSIGELCELLEKVIRELQRRGSISPTIRRRVSTWATAARVRRRRRRAG